MFSWRYPIFGMTIALCRSVPDDDILYHQWRAHTALYSIVRPEGKASSQFKEWVLFCH